MKKISIAIATGIIVGILTLIGQKYLPINLNFLANSGAIWLIPAFSLSYFFHSNLRNSISTSITCLVGCVCGYYIFEAIYNQHSFAFNRWAFFWVGHGIAGGYCIWRRRIYRKCKKELATVLQYEFASGSLCCRRDGSSAPH